MYIVEIRHNGDGLAEPMAQIRTWLVHQQIEPDVFRFSLRAQSSGWNSPGIERTGTVAA